MEATLEILRTGSRFLLTTHDLPDGDGLGSEMALHLALKQLGKTSYVLNPSETPEKFSLVDAQNEIRAYGGEDLPTVDAVFILDTNEIEMMGSLAAPLKALGVPLVFVDHHVLDEVLPGPHFMDERYAATGEMVYALVKGLGARTEPAIALALYVAIVTDTAGFRYKRTSPESHRIASELLASGVEPEKVYRSIFARESTAKLKLLGHTLENLQTSEDGRIAWMTIHKADRKRYGATVEDTESFVGFVTLLRGVEIALLFREEDDGRVKISFRGLNNVPVVELAKRFGGGGHRFAAGARVSESLATVVTRVVDACGRVLPN